MRDRILSILRSLVFVVFALVLCALVFQLAGYNAPLMLASVADGAFLRPGAIAQSLRWALPLFITAVGVGISFRAGFFNIGAQGQFYVGAIFAAFAAEWLKGGPAFIVIPACFVAGMTGGALWALWPGLLRLRSGTDEVITTLMGNFLAGLLLVYVTSGPLKDPSGSGQQASSRPLDPAYRISDSLGLSPTIIGIAVVVGIAMWLLVNRTAFGVLADTANGYPMLITEMTILTALRTAATSAMVAKYLAPKGARSMAIIGNGAQSEFQALAFKAVLGIDTLRLYDIDSNATRKCARNLAAYGFEIVECATPEEAVSGAQIITTVTADKKNATILTDNMVGSGVHLNAIGGDCPGKTELHTMTMNHNASQGNGSGWCKGCHQSGTAFLGSMEKKSLTHERKTPPAIDCSESGCHRPLGNRGTTYRNWD